MREFKKGLKVLFLTLFAYLFQACAMQYLEIGSVTASLPFVVLAVFVVSLGKKYAFCASCIIGILMESMLSNVPAMYVLAYPVITMICAQVFADLSDRQREKRITSNSGKSLFSRLRQKEMPALMRIPLCAVMMDLIWHIVMCIYMYLIGVEIGMVHISRVVSGVIYTGCLTLALMLPLRWFLGMYHRPKKKKTEEDEDEQPLKNQDTSDDEDTMDGDEEADEEDAPLPLTDDYDIYPEEGDWE